MINARKVAVNILLKIDNDKELTAEMQSVYTEFSDWLGSWEM